jgi:membrane protein
MAPRRVRQTGLTMTPSAEDPARELDSRARDQLQRSEDEADQFLERHGRLSLAVGAIAHVMRDQSADRISLAAGGAAFWLVISAFPTAIAVVSVYGLFVSPGRVASDLGALASGVPGSLGSLLTEQLRRVAATDHAHLSVGLALSLVVAIWSASSGFNNLDRAIRLAYGLPSQRYVAARRRAFVGALAVVVLLGLLAVAMPIVARRSSAFVTVPAVAVVAAGIIAGVGALYRFSVGTRVSARSLLPGALLAVAGMALVSVGFGAYVSASTHYTAVYGAFAGAVVAMLAIYFAVYGVLLGAVLNVELGGTPRASAK